MPVDLWTRSGRVRARTRSVRPGQARPGPTTWNGGKFTIFNIQSRKVFDLVVHNLFDKFCNCTYKLQQRNFLSIPPKMDHSKALVELKVNLIEG